MDDWGGRRRAQRSTAAGARAAGGSTRGERGSGRQCQQGWAVSAIMMPWWHAVWPLPPSRFLSRPRPPAKRLAPTVRRLVPCVAHVAGAPLRRLVRALRLQRDRTPAPRTSLAQSETRPRADATCRPRPDATSGRPRPNATSRPRVAGSDAPTGARAYPSRHLSPLVLLTTLSRVLASCRDWQVLIVDLWHHELRTDEARLATLDNDDMKQDYLGVVHRSTYRNTVERGH